MREEKLVVLDNLLIVLFLISAAVVGILVAPEITAAIERTLDMISAP